MLLRGADYVKPIIEFASNGIVLPLTSITLAEGDKFGEFNGGVFYENHEICETGLQIKGGYNNLPKYDESKILEQKAGCFIFGGMLQNEHFGHLVLDSLARLWAFGRLDRRFDTVVFYLRFVDQPVRAYVSNLLSLLLPDAKFAFVRAPTQFECLAVPSQLSVLGKGYVYGHPFIRQMFSRFARADGERPKKIYVSRRKLSGYYGSIICEDVIEDNLRSEGYEIIYPEMLPLDEQLSIYHSAEKLIFADGSAIHLYAFMARPAQKVFVVWRREVTQGFGMQIKTFDGPDLQGSPCVRTHFVPIKDGENKVRAAAVLDFERLGAQLKEAGFIEGHRWHSPTDAQTQKEVSALAGARRECSFL